MTDRAHLVVCGRAKAAFLGLALGDAYGAPLEFIQDETVRRQAVAIEAGEFHWTDDTQMAMYLARAILSLPAGQIDSDQLGHAIGCQFLEWLHDPFTDSLAPGTTCKSSMWRYSEDRDWRTSGNPRSDGCGAVMRICPLPMAFGGFSKCLSPIQRFDSDPERRFALLLENDGDVLKWFKPAKGDFQIHCSHEDSYEPDFVVETKTEKLLCEPKRASEMTDETVQAKADAAATWCKHATDHAKRHHGQ